MLNEDDGFCEGCGHPIEDHSPHGCQWSVGDGGGLSPCGEGEEYCECQIPGLGD